MEAENEPWPWWYITWAYVSQDEQAAMREIIESGSERTMGLLAATMLEHSLTAYIKSHMVLDNAELIQDLFRESGPLGPYATKIRLGYVMGLYSEQGRKDLEAIKEIRNRFAHRLVARDFNSELIKPLCMNLKIVEQRVRQAASIGPDGWTEERPLPILSEPKHRFMHAVNYFINSFLGRSLPKEREFPF